MGEQARAEQGFVARHPIAGFLLLAFAISWSTGSVALSGAVPLPDPVLSFLNVFAKFGPTLAAIIVVALRDGADGPRRLLSGLLRWRVAAPWWAIALGGPLLVWCVAAGLRSASGGLVIDEVDAAGALLFVPLLLRHTLLGGGLGEEPGWRGFLQPELERGRSPLAAAVIVGLLWGLWHLPAFWFAGAGKDGADPVSFLLFTLLTVVLSILFTCVWHGSGSLLIVTLLHGATNAGENTLKTVLPALKGDGPTSILYGVLLLVLTIALVAWLGRRLSRGSHGYTDPTTARGDG